MSAEPHPEFTGLGRPVALAATLEPLSRLVAFSRAIGTQQGLPRVLPGPSPPRGARRPARAALEARRVLACHRHRAGLAADAPRREPRTDPDAQRPGFAGLASRGRAAARGRRLLQLRSANRSRVELLPRRLSDDGTGARERCPVLDLL